jgi:hypothetical protein
MKYSVDVATMGGLKTVVVEADSGDNAALAAYVPGAKISNIQPYSEPAKREVPKGVKAAMKAAEDEAA